MNQERCAFLHHDNSNLGDVDNVGQIPSKELFYLLVVNFGEKENSFHVA